jgi:homoserine kinase type II
MLAGLHRAGQSYGRRQPNPRGAQWRTAVAPSVLPHLPAQEADLLQAELAWQAAQDYSTLPQGVIHADLFRDNVLWDGELIGGVIDFYFAGNDALLFDVAVTVNDWCTMTDGRLDAGRSNALLTAYGSERGFTDAERQLWPAALRAAALRFWLSRLEDKHLPRGGEMVHVKNPDEFRVVLQHRIAETHLLPAAA